MKILNIIKILTKSSYIHFIELFLTIDFLYSDYHKSYFIPN